MFRRTVRALCETSKKTMINVTFKTKKQGDVKLSVETGQSLMLAGKNAGIDIEAACDGACACCTCHVFVNEPWASSLPERSEDEEDMLDMAVDLRDNSRLSCQIMLEPSHNGMVVELPDEVVSQLF